MRVRLLFLVVVLFPIFANSTSYYFSASLGDDNRTIAEAKSAKTPWRTLEKLNAIFPTLVPGDSLLLRNGDTFYGSIDIAASGSGLGPLVISSYGYGPKPVITGFSTLNNWLGKGNNMWEADVNEAGTTLNIISINGRNQHKGRFPNVSAPNGGYLTIDSHNGNNSIRDLDLPASSVPTGAEVVIRKNRWIIDRHTISSVAGNTINYLPNPATNYEPTDGFGYFIQDDPTTLDEDGEWYYDRAAKKVLLYSSVDPSIAVIKAATTDILLSAYGMENILIENLRFEGANVEAFEIYDATNFTIRNCEIGFVGYDGVYGENLTNFTIEDCSISDVNNNAIFCANNCNNSLFKNNKISRTAIFPGSGYSGFSSYQGITVFGDGNMIEQNTVDSTGYSAISFLGSNTVARNNVVNGFAFVKDDAAGIYVWGGEINSVPITGRKVISNIVLNGIGAPEGTNNYADVPAEGVYMDDKTKDVEITGNTVAFCSHSGLFIHNAADLIVRNNTFFHNGQQLYVAHDNIAPNNPIRNVELKHNILFSRKQTNPVLRIETTAVDIYQFGSFDSNFYCRPTDTINLISARYFSNNTNRIVDQYFSLSTWKSAFGQDASTTTSNLSPTDTIIFEINPTASTKTIFFDGIYNDVENKSYYGSYNLAPYSSVILIKRTGSSTLSIRLINLTGIADGDRVKLRWETISSEEVKFIVEHSVDSRTFVPVGAVDVSSNNRGDYSFTHTSPGPGINYYRIKAIDSRGNSLCSNIAAVQMEVGSTDLTMYPNPAKHTLYVKQYSPSAEQQTVEINDLNGRLIKRVPTFKAQGTTTTLMDVSDLHPGTYTISIRGNKNRVAKFVKD